MGLTVGGYVGIDDIIQKTTVDEQSTTINYYKRLYWSTGANTLSWYSTWYSVGFPTAGSAASSSGTTYISNSTGIFLPDRSPYSKYLLYSGLTSAQQASVGIYDRLVAVGSISTTLGAKDITTPALPRYSGAGSFGVQAWAEVQAEGAAPTLRMSSYTNQDGVSGRSGAAVAFPGATATGMMVALPVQAGDTGVQSVEQLTVDVSGTTTTVTLMLIRWVSSPIFSFASGYSARDQILLGPRMSRIYDGATLVPAMFGIKFSAGIHGQLVVGWV